MIVVTMELWPAGDFSRKQHLGTATISNDGTGTALRGHYKARFSKRGHPSVIWKSGVVKNFPRTRLGAWDLLDLALRSALGSRQRA